MNIGNAKNKTKHPKQAGGKTKPGAAAHSPLQAEEANPLFTWTLMGFTLFFLVYAPFHKGLFNSARFEYRPYYSLSFNNPIYTMLIWMFILLLVVAAYYLVRWRLRDWRDAAAVYVWLLPLSYLAALPAAVSAYGTMQGFYVHMLCAGLFIVALELTRQRQGAVFASQAIAVSGYVVVLFGLLVWFMNLTFKDDGGYLSPEPVGLRLTSVFTYANSYAAYLIALILVGLFLAVNARRSYGVFLHAAMLVPTVLSLLLTLSRGGLLVLPAALILLLPLVGPARQVSALLNLGAAGIAAVAIVGKVTQIGEEFRAKVKVLLAERGGNADEVAVMKEAFDLGMSLQGWGLVAAASLAVGGIALLLRRYAEPLATKVAGRFNVHFGRFALPGLLAVVGGAGIALMFSGSQVLDRLPGAVGERLQNINFMQHSVLERGYFFKDALSIFRDYPLTGAGGSAWASLYETYQSYPYTSRQAHNFFLQNLLEVGLVGFVLFMLFIVYILLRFAVHVYRSRDVDQADGRLAFLAAAVAILLHSVIDFDMSYGFLSGLVFFCLGGMLAGIPFKPFARLPSGVAKGFRWGFPGALAVASLIMLVVSVQLLQGNTSVGKAYERMSEGNATLPEILPYFDYALRMQPYNPDYSLQKAQLLSDAYDQNGDPQFLEAARALMLDLRKREPYAREVHDNLYKWAAKEQNWADALIHAERLAELYPWDIVQYERAISARFMLGDAARQTGDGSLRDEHWDKALAWYAQILERHEQLQDVPDAIHLNRSLRPTANIVLHIGQIEFIRGDYAGAETVLKEGLRENLPDALSRSVARWYLAAVEKQGKQDPTWRERLIAADPAEAGRLQGLLQQTFD